MNDANVISKCVGLTVAMGRVGLGPCVGSDQLKVTRVHLSYKA